MAGTSPAMTSMWFSLKNNALKAENLAGVHDVERIERALDRAHDIERRRAIFGRQIFHLALADAVFAGAGAVHGKSALGEAIEKGADARDLIRVIHVDQQADVKIAVAHMADDRRHELALGDVA